MRLTDRWLLPEGIDEVLPPEAARIERLRRTALDLMSGWGYELIMPPVIEYLESLLTGLGSDLDLQTFKLIDQLSGRLLGIRADITPQAARIDAHRMQREAPVRLCYLGTVLHTRANAVDSSRNPLQLGAELYGHRGIESDLEIVSLLIELLHAVGSTDLLLNLGHVGVFHGLSQAAGFDPEQAADLYAILQRKDVTELAERLAQWRLDPALGAMVAELPDLNGDIGVLDRARARLAAAPADVHAALADIERLARAILARGAATVHVDLAEMRGYRYHTGVMFEAFVPGWGRAVAWGGRYDDVGRVFGRARPATGFSTDLKVLARIDTRARDAPGAIFAPAEDDAALGATIARLRGAGERVIRALPGQDGDAAAMGCDRRLARGAAGWQVEPL
jgi:ATP phosphoribosyltransferase regulatory subunit